MLKTIRTIISMSLVFSATFMSSSGFADSNKFVMKQRQLLMNAVRAHFSALHGHTRQESMDMDAIAFHAKQLNDVVAYFSQQQKALYPKNSTHKKSAAKPEIWKNFDDFLAKGQSFKSAAENFLLASNSGNQGKIKKGFKDLQKQCGGCHKKYKIKL